MKHQLLCLRQAQLRVLADSISTLSYHNADMTNFRDNLVALCNALQEEDVENMNEADQHDFYKLIEETVIPWVNSYRVCNEENLHKEMLSVIQQMLTDWIPDWNRNQFLILSEGDYSIERLGNAEYAKFNAYKGVNFQKIMIDVRLPKSYNDNLLYNAVLFHEIGHLVENQYNISQKVYDRIFVSPFDQPKFDEIVSQSFMSILNGGRVYNDQIKKLTKEYVCDLFGAQYVGDKINCFVEYKHHQDLDNKSTTHPTVKERIKMIDDFIEYSKIGSTKNVLLQYILDEFKSLGNDKELKVRSVQMNSADLLVGNTIPLGNSTEVYSLFNEGWSHFFNGTSNMSAAKGHTVGNTELYDTLVGSIRMSIGKYFGLY